MKNTVGVIENISFCKNRSTVTFLPLVGQREASEALRSWGCLTQHPGLSEIILMALFQYVSMVLVVPTVVKRFGYVKVEINAVQDVSRNALLLSLPFEQKIRSISSISQDFQAKASL